MREREKSPEQELEELNSMSIVDSGSQLVLDFADSGRHPPVDKKVIMSFISSTRPFFDDVFYRKPMLGCG